MIKILLCLAVLFNQSLSGEPDSSYLKKHDDSGFFLPYKNLSSESKQEAPDGNYEPSNANEEFSIQQQQYESSTTSTTYEQSYGQFQPSSIPYQPSSIQNEQSGKQHEQSSMQYEQSSKHYEPSSMQYEQSSIQNEPLDLQYKPPSIQKELSGFKHEQSSLQYESTIQHYDIASKKGKKAFEPEGPEPGKESEDPFEDFLTNSEEDQAIRDKIDQMGESLKLFESMLKSQEGEINNAKIVPNDVIEKFKKEHTKLFSFPTQPEDTRRYAFLIKHLLKHSIKKCRSEGID